VSVWARAALERGLETAEMSETWKMGPERAFQRIQERMQDVILGRGLNAFVICIRLMNP